jgi:intergrase/recombinase
MENLYLVSWSAIEKGVILARTVVVLNQDDAENLAESVRGRVMAIRPLDPERVKALISEQG